MEELLDDALQSLDKLKRSTATGAGESATSASKEREEMVMRFRTRGRSGSGSSARNLRYDSSSSSSPHSINIFNFTPTKENALTAVSACSSLKIPSALRRLARRRPAPYAYDLLPKRKPLNSLLNPPRVRSSDSYSESSNASGAKAFPEDSAFPPDASGAGGGPLSAPKRSKSLEDLTESKSVRFALFYDDNSNSNEALEPRHFLKLLKGEANIKSEIDSMSMLIEKLDVA